MQFLESETRIELNLTPAADSSKYSSHVVCKIASNILEDGVSIPSQGERTLRVTRDCKIRVIQQIVSFGVAAGLHRFSNPRKA